MSRSKGERFNYDTASHLGTVVYNADQVWTGSPQNWTLRRDYYRGSGFLNWTSVNDNGTMATAFESNDLNQYTRVNGQSVGYDGNFNVANYDGASLSYNANNQLMQAEKGGKTVQFVYDGLGRCVWRAVNGAQTLLTYDEWNPILEWDGAGNFRANVYGARADEILFRWDSVSGGTIYKQDWHGNIVALLDGNGNLVEKYTYDAFGVPTITDGGGNARTQTAIGNRFMFQGREWIPELGIYDYRHRMYQPQLGRFLQTDPTGFDAGDMNLFRYCGDDPVDRSDPTGLEYQVISDPLLYQLFLTLYLRLERTEKNFLGQLAG